MLADIRHAIRGFRRSPVFAWAAVFSLSTADRFGGSEIPVGLFRQIGERTTLLQGFAAVGNPPMTLSAGGNAERVDGQLVSENFFATLAVHAAIGRVFTGEDGVCVISYGLWQRRFGGAAGAIGRHVEIDGHPVSVIGVLPREFPGITPDSPADVMLPLAMERIFLPWRTQVQPFGRLKKGVTLEAAQAELNALYRGAARVVLRPGSRGISSLRGQYERPLVLLMAAVGLVLVIACANVINPMLTITSY